MSTSRLFISRFITQVTMGGEDLVPSKFNSRNVFPYQFCITISLVYTVFILHVERSMALDLL